MVRKKVKAVVYPDEDGGYTVVMPYFSCHIVTQGKCLTAQGETAEEALAEAARLLEEFLFQVGADSVYHLDYARLEGLEVRELEVEAPE